MFYAILNYWDIAEKYFYLKQDEKLNNVEMKIIDFNFLNVC